MKKLSIFLAAALLSVSLIGCTPNNSSSLVQDSSIVTNDEDTKDFLEFKSESGVYTAKYSKNVEIVEVPDPVEFAVQDPESRSNVNFHIADNPTKDKASSVKESDFVAAMKSQGMELEMISFDIETINGVETVVASYKYSGFVIQQLLYTTEKNVVTVTYTKAETVAEDMDKELVATLRSVKFS